MYYTKNNAIYLTRGDSMTLTVSITDTSGSAYTPASTDSIRFALKRDVYSLGSKDFADTSPLIEKTIPYNTLELTLEPEDTANLDFGNYVYDIELTKQDGTVDTFITASPFVLTPEVH